jgi:hypothetical protein
MGRIGSHFLPTWMSLPREISREIPRQTTISREIPLQTTISREFPRGIPPPGTGSWQGKSLARAYARSETETDLRRRRRGAATGRDFLGKK